MYLKKKEKVCNHCLHVFSLSVPIVSPSPVSVCVCLCPGTWIITTPVSNLINLSTKTPVLQLLVAGLFCLLLRCKHSGCSVLTRVSLLVMRLSPVPTFILHNQSSASAQSAVPSSTRGPAILHSVLSRDSIRPHLTGPPCLCLLLDLNLNKP